ncbi:unnamed protein product [Merluccius merluccius]
MFLAALRPEAFSTMKARAGHCDDGVELLVERDTQRMRTYSNSPAGYKMNRLAAQPKVSGLSLRQHLLNHLLNHDLNHLLNHQLNHHLNHLLNHQLNHHLNHLLEPPPEPLPRTTS